MPKFIFETNRYFLIDGTPLVATNKTIIFLCIKRIFHVLSHSGSLSTLTNPTFVLGLFHSNCNPEKHFKNKFASIIECAEDVNEFLKYSEKNDNIEFSSYSQVSSPNRVMHDYCICNRIKLTIAKDHFKERAFKTVINEKHCTSQY